jgi:hypothetical protein
MGHPALQAGLERQGGIGGEVGGGEGLGQEFGPGGGGDHGGVVSGESEGGEADAEAEAGGFGGEAGAEFAIGGDAAGDEDAARAKGFGGEEGLLHEVADDGVLKAGDEVEGLRLHVAEGVFDGGPTAGAASCVGGLPGPERRGTWGTRSFWGAGGVGAGEEGVAAGFGFGAEVVELDVAEDGGLDAGEGEEETGIEVGDGRGAGALVRGAAPPR